MLLANKGKSSELMSRQMERLGFSRKQLAAKIGRTVEHVRKLVSGEAFPGPDLQEHLAEVLKIEVGQLADAVRQDRWLKKYGKFPPANVQNAFLSPIQKVWDDLTHEQREELGCIAVCMAKRNRKRVPASRG